MQMRSAAFLAASILGGLALPAHAAEMPAAPNAAYAQYIQTGPTVGTPGQTSRPVPLGRGGPAPSYEDDGRGGRGGADRRSRD